MFKKQDFDDGRRRREETTVQLRKTKKEEQLMKRRQAAAPTTNNEVASTVKDIPALMAVVTNPQKSSSAEMEEAIRGFRRMLSVEVDPPVKEVIAAGAFDMVYKARDAFIKEGFDANHMFSDAFSFVTLVP